jgi:phosphatidylserine/phosphatidylglycerophosphate/cardiolipin synthase-like enzyme
MKMESQKVENKNDFGYTWIMNRLSALGGVLGSSRKLGIRSKQVKILETPQEFYAKIMHGIEKSQRRLLLSSLYIGDSPLECEMLVSLKKALTDSTRPNLTCTINLDKARAERSQGSGSGMIDEIIQELQSNYSSNRLRLGLYNCNPNRIPIPFPPIPNIRPPSTVQSLASQINEVRGVYHVKYFVSDNDVLLTGANFSHEYFTSRKDRYILFENAPHLADFLQEFNDCVYDSCEKSGQSATATDVQEKKRLTDLTNPPQSPPMFKMAHINTNSGDHHYPIEVCTPDGCTSTTSTTTSTTSAGTDTEDDFDELDTFLFPVIQHRRLGLEGERNAILNLLQSNSTHALFPSTSLTIASAYPSFTSAFADACAAYVTNAPPPAIVSTDAASSNSNKSGHVTFIYPDVHAHGFAGTPQQTTSPTPGGEEEVGKGTGLGLGLGVKTMIPYLHQYAFDRFMSWLYNRCPQHLHTHIERLCYGSLDNSSRDPTINNSHTNNKESGDGKPKHKFHAKGIWLLPNPSPNPNTEQTPSSSPQQQEEQEKVGLTYIGSSNFGERSWGRDFELGFFMAINSKTTSNSTGTGTGTGTGSDTTSLFELINCELASLKMDCSPTPAPPGPDALTSDPSMAANSANGNGSGNGSGNGNGYGYDRRAKGGSINSGDPKQIVYKSLSHLLRSYL